MEFVSMKLNRKISLCVLLLLCSCAESLSTPQANPALATQEYFEEKSSRFASDILGTIKFGESCQTVCWFGVEPGVTTADDAVALLANNGKFGVRLSKITDPSIYADWFVGKDRTLTQVSMQVEDGLVKYIIMQSMCCARVKYVVDSLGVPDGADANIYQAPDLTVTNYHIYYLEKKMVLFVVDYDLQGLDQDAFTEAIFLGDEFSVENMQPWIGYGYLKEYLPGQAWPTGLPPTP
ncbi:MAG: hypothetical protein IPP66_20940 [Anaerolineales bacterium]|nr:hypothetical protein [Anaerolineales bacterium]